MVLELGSRLTCADKPPAAMTSVWSGRGGCLPQGISGIAAQDATAGVVAR